MRAPKRKGQSGHQLMRLTSGDPGAEPIETVTQEGHVNARVAQLLGMDFQTFCRSVLLAQNRFSDFLKATRSERDKRTERRLRLRTARCRQGRGRPPARSGGRRRSKRSSGNGAPSTRLASVSMTRARGPTIAALEMKAFEGAAPEVERLETRRTAEADATAASGRTRRWRRSRIDARGPGGRPCSTRPPKTSAPSNGRKRRSRRPRRAGGARRASSRRCVTVSAIGHSSDRSSNSWSVTTRSLRGRASSGRAHRGRGGCLDERPRPSRRGGPWLRRRPRRAARAERAARRGDGRHGRSARRPGHGATRRDGARTSRLELTAGEACPVCAQPVAMLARSVARHPRPSRRRQAAEEAEEDGSGTSSGPRTAGTAVGAAGPLCARRGAPIDEIVEHGRARGGRPPSRRSRARRRQGPARRTSRRRRAAGAYRGESI